MFDALRRYRRNRVLRNAALPDALWVDACASLPFLTIYTPEELARLRDLVVLFLDAKSIVGAQGHEVTPLQRTIIAIQACVLVLELDLSLYDGFESIIVYPGEFVPGVEFEDEYGIVHRRDDALAGEAMDRGPVVLSWPDVEASADWDETGMNLVIHEFAHKIDMADGDANGSPPLSDADARNTWTRVMRAAYDDFVRRVDRDEDTAIDSYAAESPGEFFAVLSEVFFAEPLLLLDEYQDVYDAFARFYHQDPATRQGDPR
ncbi:MAG TPA: M90 family metallopeptidase [Casimicrobiaceae bacterium]|nr:M90 family metallopeptidase [Casimicrobiaceae bacterium]